MRKGIHLSVLMSTVYTSWRNSELSNIERTRSIAPSSTVASPRPNKHWEERVETAWDGSIATPHPANIALYCATTDALGMPGHEGTASTTVSCTANCLMHAS